jgi:protein-S-isoprenylcysteine O-methyltransferase Ste14
MKNGLAGRLAMPWVQGIWGAMRSMLPIAAPLLFSAVLVQDRDVFLRAGRLLVLCTAVVMAAQVRMAFVRPASLQIRKTRAFGAHGQPLIDAAGLLVFLVYVVGWLTFLPLDAARLHLLTEPPPWATALGLLSAVLGCALGQRAIWDNAFASPAVKKHEGQLVVSSGAYGAIRHPLYAGNVLLFAGTALWIGSLAGLLGVAVILAFTFARIVVEERHLRESLPGYSAYTRTVRARLIPFVF